MQIEKEWLKRAVREELFGNSVSQEIQFFFDELLDEIVSVIEGSKTVLTLGRYKEIMSQIEELAASFEEEAVERLDERLSEIIKNEASWLTGFMLPFGKKLLLPKTLESKTKFVVSRLAGSTDIASEASRSIRSQADRLLKTAYMMRSWLGDADTRLASARKKIKQSIDTSVKTFCTSVFRGTDISIFRLNKIKLKYSAVLDSHTCLVCASMHGQIFSPDSAPPVPQHHRCRCLLVPVINGDEQDGYSFFSEWLSALDDDELYEVLGRERYKLYKNGFPPDEFTDSGRVIPLDEL